MIAPKNVTVAIPTIPGREDLLARALASVDAQTVTPRRVLIHNDTERQGAAWCRNHLLKQVRTSWLAWLDDDDEMLPHHLETLIAGGNESGADLIYPNREMVGAVDPLATCDDNGNVAQPPDNVPFGARQEQWLRELGNFIPDAHLVRTAALRDVGGYPAPWSVPVPVGNNSGGYEDYLMLIKLLDAGYRFHHVLGVITYRYHVHGGNTAPHWQGGAT